MQRRTAQFLLLLAVVGTFIPVALAVTAPPQHACCIRATHHCHNSSASNQPAVSSAETCNHACCRGAVTAQWAVIEPSVLATPGTRLGPRAAESSASTYLAKAFSFKSPRAPPQSFFA
jgi:hypothetical protein